MTPLHLAWLRYTRGGTGLRLVSVTVAVCCTSMLLMSALGVALQRSVVEDALNSLPKQDRSATVSFDGDPARATFAAAEAASELRPLSDGPLQSYLSYRPMWDGTAATYQLAASAQLADEVTLTSGRLPEQCNQMRCEVLQLSGGVVSVTDLGLAVVGQATWKQPPPLQRAIDPSAVLLVSADIATTSALPTMAAVAQSRMWSVEVATGQVAQSPTAWLRQVAATAAGLGAADGRLVLAVPDAEVARAARQANSVDRRVQGMSLALAAIAAWAVALAVQQRRSQVLQAARVARQYRPDLRLPYTLDVAIPVAIGAGAAAVVGPLTSALLRWPATSDAGWLAAATAAIGSAAAGRATLPGKARVTAAALTLISLATSAWLLRVWPTVIAATVAAGLLAAAAGALPWRRTTVLRRAITANNRAGLAATTGVIALATAATVATLVQGSMLTLNAQDHARFVSPLPARVTALAQQPLTAISLTNYRAMGNAAYPVARLPATARSGMLDAAAVQVIGLPSGALAALPNLRHQTGVTSAQWRALEPSPLAVGVAVRGSQLRLGAQGVDRNAVLSVWLADDSMRTRSATCTTGTPDSCTVALPSSDGGDRILGVSITEDPGNRARREHAAGEGDHDVLAPRGTARVTGLPERPAVTIDYDLAHGPAYLPIGRASIPQAAIVDPITAAQAVDGVVVLRLSPATTIALRVAGVAQRFPTAPPRFAVVGISALAEQLANSDPSLMVIPDVWLGSDLSNSAIATVRAAGAAVTTQSGVIEAMAVASARLWTLRGIGLAVLALLAVAGIAAAGLADEIARRTPAQPWQRIGVTAADYRTAVTRSVAVSSIAGAVIGAGISAPIAARSEALLATDVLGAAATPPLATSIPALPAAAMVVVVVTVTVAIASYRTRSVMELPQ